MSRLFWKALLAFLVLPGAAAFLVPLTVFRPRPPVSLDPFGFVVLSVGIVVLLATVREFYVAGRGTLAPWSPPRELVTTGLYGVSRHPMYVAVVLLLLGWAALFHSAALLIYALAVATAFICASSSARSRGSGKNTAIVGHNTRRGSRAG
jgi:protein-S-isoprenylcysteine O-methyltransferase Ste14